MRVPPAGQHTMLAVVADERLGELAEVIGAADPPAAFPGILHGRQQEAHERADDGDCHEQFHEREGVAGLSVSHNAVPFEKWSSETMPSATLMHDHGWCMRATFQRLAGTAAGCSRFAGGTRG